MGGQAGTPPPIRREGSFSTDNAFPGSPRGREAELRPRPGPLEGAELRPPPGTLTHLLLFFPRPQHLHGSSSHWTLGILFPPLLCRCAKASHSCNLWVSHHLLLVPLIPLTPLPVALSLKSHLSFPQDPECHKPLSHIALTCTNKSNAQRNRLSLKHPQSQTH